MTRTAALYRFRLAEANQVRRWFARGARVLDIGAGTGYQARTFAEWGCQVCAIDVERRPADDLFWPVTIFDGVQIPFRDSSFDILFSSNVIEHVKRPQMLLAGSIRLLAPGGHAIHIVPSASWRWWTSSARYIHTMRALMASRAGGTEHSNNDGPVSRRTKYHSWSDILLGPPHGEFPAAVDELKAYRCDSWRKLFEEAGYDVVEVSNNGLFYTGYTLLPHLSLKVRRALASVLGASCHVFVLRPRLLESR
jgi:SAM-dependent methyltransferase